MEVRYTYRLRPGQTARRYLAREWGMCRYVWNALVAESAEQHLGNQIALGNGATREVLPTFGYAEQDKYLTRLRASTVDEGGVRWLAQGSSVAQQQTVRDFAAARSKALADRRNKIPVSQRRGLPRFKSRHRALASMNYTLRGFALIDDPASNSTSARAGAQRLRLPGGVLIPVVWSRPLPSAPKSARVYCDSLGHWYVSFVVAIDVEHLPVPVGAAPIGVDWGVTQTATTTEDAYDLDHLGHGKNAAAKLARYQRMMARRRPARGQAGSKGYAEAKRQSAKVAKKVARQRQDQARKWAKSLVADHDQIAVEDFRPKFLAKSSMARKATDGAIGQAKAELIWQATKHGRDLRLVHPAHTTTDCSTCGARTKHRLPLGQRIYTCDACGTSRPRDKNSAAIMVARAGFVPADAEGISPEPAAVRAPAA